MTMAAPPITTRVGKSPNTSQPISVAQMMLL